MPDIDIRLWRGVDGALHVRAEYGGAVREAVVPAVKGNPDQPRVPAGSPEGGQFAGTGGGTAGGGGAADVYSGPGVYRETFRAPSGDAVHVVASDRGVHGWEVFFGGDSGRLDVTGREGAGAVRVLRHVGEAVGRFIADKKPEKFHFEAKGWRNSRVRLYDRGAKMIARRHGYALNRTRGLSGTRYSFTRAAADTNP